LIQSRAVENIKTHTIRPVKFYSENLAFYEIRWKNNIDRGRPQVAIWRMRFACWIRKVKVTNSEYAILNDFCTASMVMRTQLNILLHAHCLSC